MELARGIEPPTCGLQIRWSSYFKQTAIAAPIAYFDALGAAFICFEGVRRIRSDTGRFVLF